jgi:truncated hemoglobin YjbI
VRELIYAVVENFYEKVIDDVLIGYHFAKFRDKEVLAHHLERLTTFWEMQLTGTATATIDRPFHLLFTHLQLNLKRGELGRWIVLFHQTLDSLEAEVDHPNVKEMCELWKKRIALFEERFKAHPQMFSANF